MTSNGKNSPSESERSKGSEREQIALLTAEVLALAKEAGISLDSIQTNELPKFDRAALEKELKEKNQ